MNRYNGERPHRSCGLRPPTANGDPVPKAGRPISRRMRLGGLLSDYRQLLVAA